MQFKFYAVVAVIGLSFAFKADGEPTNSRPLLGFNPASVLQERELESRFDASLKKDNLRDWMKRMTAKPHHVGSPFGKEVAEFIASQFRSWGYATEIEQFDVLFPTPKLRLLEMVEPQKFQARLA